MHSKHWRIENNSLRLLVTVLDQEEFLEEEDVIIVCLSLAVHLKSKSKPCILSFNLIWCFLFSACESKAPKPIVEMVIPFTHNLQNTPYGDFDFPNQTL